MRRKKKFKIIKTYLLVGTLNLIRFFIKHLKSFAHKIYSNIDWKYYGIDTTKFLPQSATEMFGAKTNSNTLELTKFQDNEYIKPNKYHPNQRGHELIAKNLHDFIKKND